MTLPLARIGVLVGVLAPLARAGCSNAAWTDDYSPERCYEIGSAAVVKCDGRNASECGMRMSSNFNVGIGIHSMTIKGCLGPLGFEPERVPPTRRLQERIKAKLRQVLLGFGNASAAAQARADNV
eukprot:CAMPEP_0179057922 /NCGR_PEP_ID=MMETSP0796-20121207/24583_1 /TAXON_ID=73915 /ORGANISM="Pyrodinium bahamense, Strain pbaha01" /LENGTH=124 /DNA_ID=CAMNT_0020754655 /DNA_START=48 /DNA_END=422 /DNA_ORIENTATION=-